MEVVVLIVRYVELSVTGWLSIFVTVIKVGDEGVVIR